MRSLMASWAGGILVGTAWGLLIASPLSGVIGSLDTNGQPTSPVMALRGYAAATGALSDALAASDDTFDLAWADGDAGWEQIEVAANASAAIIDAALAAFAADRAALPAGPGEEQLVRLAERFEGAATATRACVGIIQRSARSKSLDDYYASFPCFSASNAALDEARASLAEFLASIGTPREN